MSLVAKNSKKEEKKSVFDPLYTLGITEEKSGSRFFPEYFILSKTAEAVNNLHSLYKVQREDKFGPSSQWEQDLYRSMFVFACAGLDACVKKLVEARLPQLVDLDPDVKKEFEKYIYRRTSSADWNKLLAATLADVNPRQMLINQWVESYTGESLQSLEQLCSVSNALQLDTNSLVLAREAELKDAFKARNQIIHEMDINMVFSGPRSTAHRTRIVRQYSIMAKYTILILNVAEEFFKSCRAQFS